jgi:glycosyltransferase involved in cell wall biosynthesis
MTLSPSDQPFFTVVIPTYNRADLVGKTLDTVFAQTFRSFEVIVVDNCSTDDTEALLAPLVAAGKLRYIRHDRNYERARSRNTGMENARGEYLTFLDSDDLMYPNNLSDAAAYIERTRAAGQDARFFHNLYELVDSGGRVLHRYSYPRLDDHHWAIMEGNFLSCIGVFLHRDLYGRFRFDTDPSLTGSEDWEYWLRVSAEHLPGRIPWVNSAIVQHGGRTMAQVDLPALRARMALVRHKILQDPVCRRVYTPYLHKFDVSCRLFMAIVANSGRKHGEALQLMLEAVRLDPRVISWGRFWRALRIAVLRLDMGS